MDQPISPPPESLPPLGDKPRDFITRMYDEHGAMVLRILARMGIPARVVEELAHDAWLAAFDSLASFDGNNFRAWICHIARRKALDWKRRKANHMVSISTESESGREFTQEPTTTVVPLGLMLQAESIAILRDCMSLLSPKWQAIARMKCEGHRSEYIGAEISMKPGTVDSNWFKIKQQLSDCVTKKLADG